MGMAAPKGMAPAAPQAGLAAIAQPSQAPKGMSSGSMQQVMSLARKMSDAQLADVLQGKSLDVPQYVAMTEAMGRKSLRTAMQGQQAMAQAQQPSVKQKLLMGDQPQMQGIQQGMPMPQQPVMAAEGGLMYADGGPVDMNMSANAGGGLAELPAPNMEPLTLASGGIVAFDEGGEVPRFNEGGNWFTEFRDSLYSPEERRIEAMKRGRATDQPTDTLSENQLNAFLRGKTPGPAEAPMPPASMQKEIDDSKMRLFRQEMADKEAAANAKPVFAGPSGGPTVDQINALNARPRVTGGASNEKAGIGATDEFGRYMDMVKKNNADYLTKLEGMGAKQREGLAQLRSQGGGEALMNLAQGILSRPGLAAGVAAGLPGVTATAAASRKEQRAVEQAANDYDLNVAKAQEAAAKGDMEAALMFKKMADEAKYRADDLSIKRAALGQEPDMLRTLKGIAGNPKLEALYGKTGKADVLDRDKAAALWEKLSRNEKANKYGNDFETYYKTMNNQLLSATIPGQGANVIGTLK
jgi:hypothetical protein